MVNKFKYKYNGAAISNIGRIQSLFATLFKPVISVL